jgi:hypothetical protein
MYQQLRRRGGRFVECHFEGKIRKGVRRKRGKRNKGETVKEKGRGKI